MSGPIIVFEGLTLNRAGELLCDTAATVWERTVASKLYVRCLEDFVFGVVFGNSISTGKVQDVLPGVAPFKDLSQDLSLNVHELDAGGPAEEQLLIDPDEREIVRCLILDLEGALARDPDAWRSLARREVSGSIHDPALTVDLDDRSEYKFSGRPNFWPDRELQHLVPSIYLSAMTETVKKDLPLPPGTSEKALGAFLSRNVLAHILIFRRYQIGFRERHANGAALHVTYPTRASLVSDHDDATWRVRNYLVPRVILQIVDKSLTRGDFRKELRHLASAGRLDEHRRLLSEALTYQAQGEIDRAEGAIEALVQLSTGEPPDIVRVGNTNRGGRVTPLPIAVRQQLIKREYCESLQKIFHEIAL